MIWWLKSGYGFATPLLKSRDLTLQIVPRRGLWLARFWNVWSVFMLLYCLNENEGPNIRDSLVFFDEVNMPSQSNVLR